MKKHVLALVLFFVLIGLAQAGSVTFVAPEVVAIEEPIVMPKDVDSKNRTNDKTTQNDKSTSVKKAKKSGMYKK